MQSLSSITEYIPPQLLGDSNEDFVLFAPFIFETHEYCGPCRDQKFEFSGVPRASPLNAFLSNDVTLCSLLDE